jgi:hypothetical protein
MRGFQRGTCAETLSRGHGLVQNLRNGCSVLSTVLPHSLRLATAWPRLTGPI